MTTRGTCSVHQRHLTLSRAAQDAINYNQRNINEEGGGGYLGFCWDNAYWGTQVKLASLIGSQNPAYAQEVRPFSEALWTAEGFACEGA